MNKLEKFRARWNRWLGQKCRKDKKHYVVLFESNWIGWADKILDRSDTNKEMVLPSRYYATREDIKHYFHIAILQANMEDLHALDQLYCIDKFNL